MELESVTEKNTLSLFRINKVKGLQKRSSPFSFNKHFEEDMNYKIRETCADGFLLKTFDLNILESLIKTLIKEVGE